MIHVTHMNESCLTYEWVTAHTWIKVILQIKMNHVSHMIESCHTWMSHVTHEWVMPHMRPGVDPCGRAEEAEVYRASTHLEFAPVSHINQSYHIWTSHATHMNESCHTYERVMPHIWTSHVTYKCVTYTHYIWDHHTTYESVPEQALACILQLLTHQWVMSCMNAW